MLSLIVAAGLAGFGVTSRQANGLIRSQRIAHLLESPPPFSVLGAGRAAQRAYATGAAPNLIGTPSIVIVPQPIQKAANASGIVTRRALVANPALLSLILAEPRQHVSVRHWRVHQMINAEDEKFGQWAKWTIDR